MQKCPKINLWAEIGQPREGTPFNLAGAYESLETLESRLRTQPNTGGQPSFLDVDWYFADMLRFVHTEAGIVWDPDPEKSRCFCNPDPEKNVINFSGSGLYTFGNLKKRKKIIRKNYSNCQQNDSILGKMTQLEGNSSIIAYGSGTIGWQFEPICRSFESFCRTIFAISSLRKIWRIPIVKNQSQSRKKSTPYDPWHVFGFTWSSSVFVCRYLGESFRTSQSQACTSPTLSHILYI